MPTRSSMIVVPTNKLVPIVVSNDSSQKDLIEIDWGKWWEEEKQNLRLRFPDEEYWPDDYYERLEAWWVSSPQARVIEPIIVAEKYEIIDGYHRYAISIIHGIKELPVLLPVRSFD